MEVTVEQVRPVAVKGNSELCEPLAALVYYKTYDSEICECWERLQYTKDTHTCTTYTRHTSLNFTVSTTTYDEGYTNSGLEKGLQIQ